MQSSSSDIGCLHCGHTYDPDSETTPISRCIACATDLIAYEKFVQLAEQFCSAVENGEPLSGKIYRGFRDTLHLRAR